MLRIASAARSFMALMLCAGCSAIGSKTPLAAIRRVPHEMKAEIADAVRTTQRQVSKTWADVWHDWNYTEDDAFTDIRNASGM